MNLKRFQRLCLAAIAGACLLAASHVAQAATRAWWNPRCYWRSTTSIAANSAAQANRSSQRRYSFAPSSGTYSAPAYSPSSGSRGLNGSYRPGPGYSPRNGINRADFKIRGL